MPRRTSGVFWKDPSQLPDFRQSSRADFSAAGAEFSASSKPESGDGPDGRCGGGGTAHQALVKRSRFTTNLQVRDELVYVVGRSNRFLSGLRDVASRPVT
jgi:hypothetical protein